MLEVSAIDTFASMHLGDVVTKNGGVGGVGVGRKATRSSGESRASSSSSSSSGYGDEVQFQVTPQISSQSTSTSSNSSSGGSSTKKPSKVGGWWRNWRESEKVKEDKRRALEAARRRLRTNSLRVDDEQNASAFAAIQRRHNKMDVDSPDDSTRHDSDGEPVMRPRSRTIASPSDISQKKLPTVFRWEGNAQHVYITGSFDNWKSRTPLMKSNEEHYTIIDLPQGDHQYRYLVDGQWHCDPNGVLAGVGENGLQSNLVSVRESDFEVFEALAVDSVSNGEEKQRLRSGSPVGEYSQDIPSRSSMGSGLYQSGPPVLPPHLLQVMLNKEVPLHCEPTLLPEPNHVMLNHLYALSIRDGVMVLSSTFRFHKKYVTTVLYKPA